MVKHHNRRHRRNDGICYDIMLSYEGSNGVDCIYPVGLDDSTWLGIKCPDCSRKGYAQLVNLRKDAVIGKVREVKIGTIEMHGMEPVDGQDNIEFKCPFGAQVRGQETEVFEVQAGVFRELDVPGAVAGDEKEYITALCVEYRRVRN
ncbi:hypothetical protein Ddye_014682 [Dipteronia dyeriana]|uniref:Uncharacterized protein n=1 Tax=Dipteronia dyeriana TaxID=168575 RepID=A0AAD9X897_9ROSI|nr:hypothetical protein Ddye_014682 [Dipteronia dyeriana]